LNWGTNEFVKTRLTSIGFTVGYPLIPQLVLKLKASFLTRWVKRIKKSNNHKNEPPSLK